MTKQARPQSMASRLCRLLAGIGVLCVLLTALGSAALFYKAFSDEVDARLETAARAAAAAYQSGDVSTPDQLQDHLLSDTLRLTLIDTDGTVLYDSLSRDPQTMENHADRPEVTDALQDGVGQEVRSSATAGYETHYYALRLDNGQVLRVGQDTRTLWSAYNRVLPLLVIGCVAVAALAAALAFVLTRRLVAPIEQLADHLDTIEADVPYEELIPLAHTVQSDRKLREDNETIRREFTANVSHELKTPLTSISGYAELIESGMAKAEDIPTFGHRIHKEAQRMIALVSDILQLSELDGMHESHRDHFEPQPVDLTVLVRETAANMTMNARKAYITLQYTAQPATVQGSHDLLGELLMNLCDNAIRYNRPGGHVQIACGTASDGSAWLSVEDNGIGIPQDSQNRVFERFYRVDKSRSKATGGTGLGLAIVKHIAMLHDAKIELQSQVGSGTLIKVTFPA